MTWEQSFKPSPGSSNRPAPATTKAKQATTKPGRRDRIGVKAKSNTYLGNLQCLRFNHPGLGKGGCCNLNVHSNASQGCGVIFSSSKTSCSWNKGAKSPARSHPGTHHNTAIENRLTNREIVWGTWETLLPDKPHP